MRLKDAETRMLHKEGQGAVVSTSSSRLIAGRPTFRAGLA